MKYQNIYSQTENFISTLVINRPNKLNALNKETLEEISRALSELEKDENTRVVILTGAGQKAFVAGADIAEFAHFSVEEGTALAREGQEKVFDRIENFAKPIIAAVNGFALGGGLELAMAAHFRIASRNARMGLPETSLGLIPGYGGSQRLPQLIGKGRALEMIMTAGMIDAQKALEYGLVNHVVELEDLITKAEEIAQKIISNSSTAVSTAIKAVNVCFDKTQNGFEKEIELFGESFGTRDFEEGTRAFLEKRKASFPGN